MLTVDALECSVFDEEIFRELRAGDLTCVTCTVAFWEGTIETLDAIARWRDLARENSDRIRIALSAGDIVQAAVEGRTAILLGAQNSTPLDGRIRFVELLFDLGLRVMQVTYNNQNEYGGSCYEDADSGLSRAGRALVREMNRVGMVIDLSHVGEVTGRDIIEISEQPVAVTHANPASLVPHRRNKSDDFLRALAESGGVLGLATYRNIAGEWIGTLERWCEMVARTVEIVGVEHVGIGTDLARKSGERELDWMRRGRWTREVNFGAGSAASPGKVEDPDWFRSTADFPAIAGALGEQGFNGEEVELLMGRNWLRLYEGVFG